MNRPEIARLVEALAEPRQQIETAFVSVGANLTSGAAMLNKLTRQFEALPDALQGEGVEEASAKLKAIATKAAELTEGFAQEKADLEKLVDVVAAANAPINELRRAVKMMGIVSVNARVTAAGIIGDNDDFEVFTTDIASLSDNANATIQEFSQVYRQLVVEVTRAAGQRERFENAHAHTLTELAASLLATIDALNIQRERAAEGSAETGRVSRQIVGRIGSAVMGLQVGDATRQRLEHIEAALTGLDEGADAETLAALSELQQKLLTDAANTFAAEVGDAETALRDLASDANTIMARSRDLYGAESGSVMSTLNAQLNGAVAILRDCDAERSKLEAVATAVHETVTVLLGHVAAVQEIEANMRLVSLNAAVRCAQLGPRGASLTVIAQQLRALTSETVVAAEAAMTRLDESSALARAFGAAASGESAGQIGRMEAQAIEALELLNGLEEKLMTALSSLKSDGPRVIKLLQLAATGLGGQTAHAETLHDIALSVAALSVIPAPRDVSPTLGEHLAALRKTYTMEAERAVHDSLFGNLAAAGQVEHDDTDDLSALMF